MRVLQNKRGAARDIAALSKGLDKHFAGKTLSLGGKKMPTAAVIAALQRYANVLAAIERTRATLDDLIRAARTLERPTQLLVVDLHQYVWVMVGNTNARLADFGMKPRTRRKPTVATKQAAIAKSGATRVARRTMGKTQKARIRGAAKPG